MTFARPVHGVPTLEGLLYVAAVGPSGPVEINQLEDEFEQALDLYRERAPSRVLEIGTCYGGSLYHWLQHAAPGAFIVSVDIDMSLISQATADEWAPSRVECILIQGDTQTPWTQDEIRKYGPYDWVFIDGCHEYQSARNDWEAFKAMCNPGAHILLHDIALHREYDNGRTAGVHQLLREIQAEGYWTREIRAHPNLAQYGIVCVRL